MIFNTSSILQSSIMGLYRVTVIKSQLFFRGHWERYKQAECTLKSLIFKAESLLTYKCFHDCEKNKYTLKVKILWFSLKIGEQFLFVLAFWISSKSFSLSIGPEIPSSLQQISRHRHWSKTCALIILSSLGVVTDLISNLQASGAQNHKSQRHLQEGTDQQLAIR